MLLISFLDVHLYKIWQVFPFKNSISLYSFQCYLFEDKELKRKSYR